MSETETVPGYIVACMTCHSQLGTLVYTIEAAQHNADIHLTDGDKPHSGHEVTITPTQVVRVK